jgi:hypothetical protein
MPAWPGIPIGTLTRPGIPIQDYLPPGRPDFTPGGRTRPNNLLSGIPPALLWLLTTVEIAVGIPSGMQSGHAAPDLECGDLSPLSGAELLSRRAACRPGKPEHASWPKQHWTLACSRAASCPIWPAARPRKAAMNCRTPDGQNARPQGALECGDSSPLSGADLLSRRAACRPGKPEHASWPKQHWTFACSRAASCPIWPVARPRKAAMNCRTPNCFP